MRSILPRFHPRAKPAAAGLALLCALALLTGCVTSKKYRLAKADTPPPKVLEWNSATPPAELTLHSLIVFKGPGSWKREARWDEYVVRLSNRGEQPLTVNAITLTDLRGAPQYPGDDPWKLEKLSYTNWDKYGKSGLKLVAGAGVLLVYGAAVEGVAMASMWTGATTAGGTVLLDVIPIVALVEVGAVAVINHDNKYKVQHEFDRRRLTFPRTFAPGETVEGSLFFPMTPGPQQLVLHGQTGDAAVESRLELKPLVGLHLAPASGKM